jgi:hypothetical protein
MQEKWLVYYRLKWQEEVSVAKFASIAETLPTQYSTAK